MEEITSLENVTFKELLKLTDKKWRRRLGLCIIEGEKIVRERGGRVFIRGSSKKAPSFGNDFIAEVIYISSPLFNKVSSLENCNFLSVVPIPSSRAVTFPYLVLDGLQDSGNMGTILRTAAAFGFLTVFCLDCVDVWSQKVLRASSGVQFDLNIIETSRESFQKPQGSTLVAADLYGETAEHIKGNFGLALGNEGHGLSTYIKSLIDRSFTIPMNKCVESLNVSVAGGILMYELGRGKNIKEIKK